MSYDEIRAIAEAWMNFWQGGDLDKFDDVHSEDFIDHTPAERGRDRAAFKRSIEELYIAFPDFSAKIEDIIIDATANKVSIRWSATGTHQGTFLGYAATGRIINFAGIEIIRIEEGKVIERWGEWDGQGIVRQLAAG